MKRTQRSLKKYILYAVSILLVLMLLNSFFYTYSILLEKNNLEEEFVADILQQEVNAYHAEINNFPRSIGNDLLFLHRLSSLAHIANSDTLDSEQGHVYKQDLAEDFVHYMKSSPAFYQLRYINTEGDEIVRVTYDRENYTIVPEENLQNKKDRPYFSYTMDLSDGEVFISRFDLNVEDGESENRGTRSNPEYVPVIRLATPVFDEFGIRKGMIVLNVYVDFILEGIEYYEKDDEFFVLLNNKGEYLFHPDKTKEFAFMFDREESFYKDHPEVARVIFSDPLGETVRTDSLTFTYKYLYPTLGTFGLHEGAKGAYGQHSEDEYFWVLGSISDTAELSVDVQTFNRHVLILFV